MAMKSDRFQKDDGRLTEGRYDGTEPVKKKAETQKLDRENQTHHRHPGKGPRTSRVR